MDYFDPFKAAALRVDLTSFANLNGVFRNISAGTKYLGKRKYTIRYEGKYNPGDLADMILQWRDGKPICFRDVVKIKLQMMDATGSITQNGSAALVMNVISESGANVSLVICKSVYFALIKFEHQPKYYQEGSVCYLLDYFTPCKCFGA